MNNKFLTIVQVFYSVIVIKIAALTATDGYQTRIIQTSPEAPAWREQ